MVWKTRKSVSSRSICVLRSEYITKCSKCIYHMLMSRGWWPRKGHEWQKAVQILSLCNVSSIRLFIKFENEWLTDWTMCNVLKLRLDLIKFISLSSVLWLTLLGTEAASSKLEEAHIRPGDHDTPVTLWETNQCLFCILLLLQPRDNFPILWMPGEDQEYPSPWDKVEIFCKESFLTPTGDLGMTMSFCLSFFNSLAL